MPDLPDAPATPPATPVRESAGANTSPGLVLAGQMIAALELASTLPAGHLREYVVMEALEPLGGSGSRVARELIRARGLVIIGSRGENPATGRDHAAVFVSASPTTWRAAAAWLVSHPKPRPLAGFELATASVRTHAESESSHVHPSAWEAVLHPCADAAGHTQPQPPAEVEAFTEAVRAVGGSVAQPRGPRAASLTYLALTLPSDAAALELASYNALRSLRPMPRIALR